tara:strand:+ start:1605 stop:2270 length:666 start_codon:yes stop_codon:yes gene_type:complete
MNFTKKDLIYLLGFCIMFYYFNSKTEKMSNTDVKKIIEEQYKIDVDAIRNLSKLANDLTLHNKLTIPGGLEIQGNLKVTGDATIGPAYIGTYGKTDSNYAVFTHKNMTKKSQYAFMQHKDGNTYINTPQNKQLHLRVNNIDKMYIQPNGDIRMLGILACNNHAHFNAGAHFYGWSGWATKNQQKPYPKFSSSNVYIRGINENGNLYIGTKYGSTLGSKKAT